MRTWLSGKVKQGMQNSHGEVVAVTVGPRTDVLWCIAAQGPLGAALCTKWYRTLCTAAHWGRWGPRVAVAPPRADAEVFAQPEHLSLSSIQPVHTADKHHAVHCTSVGKKRALSCYCTYFTALLGGRVSLPSRGGELNCCSAAAAHWQVARPTTTMWAGFTHTIFLGYF